MSKFLFPEMEQFPPPVLTRKILRQLPGVRKKKRKPIEPVLFEGSDDRELHSPNHSAAYIGDFFEEASQSVLGPRNAQRLVTDANAQICPDLQETSRREFYVESKSCHSRKDIKVYDRSMEGYRCFLETYFPPLDLKNPDFDPSLVFFLWFHGVDHVSHIGWIDPLKDHLAAHIQALYVLDFDILCKVLAQLPRKDYTQCGYPPFRQLRIGHLKPLSLDWQTFMEHWNIERNGHRFTQGTVSDLKVYGRSCAPFPVFILVDKTVYGKEQFDGFLNRRNIG